MKALARFWALALALALVLLSPAWAQEGEYTYTVRIFAGEQGTIGGQTVVVYDDLAPGAVIRFSGDLVTLKDPDRYYVKGIRESGRDNADAGANPYITVTGDRDYVVAYGIRGQTAAYTIDYQDESGTPLAPSDTFYGNVGDKPVAAAKYIDGYLPRYYNITGTLTDGAQRWAFVYRPLAQSPRPSGSAAPSPSPVAVAETTAPTVQTAAKVPDGTLIQSPAYLDAAQLSQPQELLDLDGPAQTPGQQADTPSNSFRVWLWALAAGLVVAAGIFLRHRRRKRNG